MKKIYLKEYPNDDKKLFQPAFEKDAWIFQHCLDGLMAATPDRLLKAGDVFAAHGYELCEMHYEY